MSNIVLKNVCKSYDKEHYAVQDFSLEIPDREFAVSYTHLTLPTT